MTHLSRFPAIRVATIGIIAWLVALLTGLTFPNANSLVAAEPADKFLERLREEKMYDWAAKYIDIYSKAGLLPADLKRDATLERLMILQDSLSTVRTVAQRDATLVEIEKGFEDFLDKSPDHPRRNEARLRLGNIALARGQAELKKIDDPKEKNNAEAIRATARKHLLKGDEVFTAAVAELKTVLEKLAGNRATSVEDKELRKKLQGEYRQSQIYDGYATKLIATSYPTDKAEYKEWLKKADTKLAEVVSKSVSATEVGAKTLSRLYRGDVLVLLGEADQAIESYTSVADIEEPGIFREWRVQATAAIMRALSSEAGKHRFEEAIQRGSELWKQVQNTERDNPEWLDLQLAMAETRIGYSKALRTQDKEAQAKSQQRDARELLTVIVRRPGDHQAKAKQLLADLGVEAVDPNEAKTTKVKNFAEAFKAGRERLQKSDSANLTLEILNDRLKNIGADDKPDIEKEIMSVKETSKRDLAQALELLQKSLQLYKPEDERSELLEARFYTAFIYLKQEKFWEASAVADFVSRSGAGTETGLKASQFALIAYPRLMASLPKERQTNVVGAVEAFAKHMLATWPKADETQSATVMLLQQALGNQRWDDAERYLRLLPPENDQSKSIKRDLGFILYVEYLRSIDAARQSKEPANIQGDVALRDRTERLLKEGWDALEADKIDQRSVEAASALVAIYLRTNRLQEATEIFSKEGVSPLLLVQQDDPRIKSAQVKLEVLRLNLQSKVMAAARGGASLDGKEIQSIVQRMQSVATNDTKNGDENAIKLLTNGLLILAKDLQEQLANEQDATNQAKLATAIQVLMKQLADVSNDAATLDWAGTTLWQLGEGLKSKPAMLSLCKDLNKSAAIIFQKLINLGTTDPDALKSINRKVDDIQYKQGMSYRAMGEHEEAAKAFIAILRSNPNLVSVQIEAAKNYQESGTGKDIELLKKAYLGSEPDPKTNKNIVWGWGTIAQKISGKLGEQPELKKIFFDARLQLADCRYESAKIQPAADLKKKFLEQSLSDIRQTYLMYPEMNGPESVAEFDKQTIKIQSELQKPTVGLKEFQ